MTSGQPPDLYGLTEARQLLRDFCQLHEASVRSFQVTNESWFRMQPEETTEPLGAGEAPRVKHLSSTASCLESLLDSGSAEHQAVRASIDEFTRIALELPDDRWTSDGAAHTYCRVRTLPILVETASDDALNVGRVAQLCEFAWKDVAPGIDTGGIAEHPLVPAEGQLSYPPNAFMTYWGLRLVAGMTIRGGEYGEAAQAHGDRTNIAKLWSERTLAAHTSLAAHNQERADPQQLAWAITSLVGFTPWDILRRPHNRELLQAGLAALFEMQHPSGNWSHGEPLFHFPTAGNAYCYTFETLAELLRHAVQRGNTGQFLRNLLKPFGANLLRAFDYLQQTAVGSDTAEKTLTWSSGNHPHRTSAESWATGAAFSFGQHLRILVGVWAREEASKALGVRVPRWDVGRSLEKLKERGETWDFGRGWSVSQRLAGWFVNPSVCYRTKPARLDPDEPLMEEKQARSAILFGPPGTSKTTLVEAVAGAIGWDYVEIHASDFLREGMDNVPRRADLIFQQVMELDHCVVLFDEIDELLRDRGQAESDPFGRFLTTSMLPKLAKLWDQKRVIFFVNTNWIDMADPAIKRSQRFDASIFVMPPSFRKKLGEIEPSLNEESKGNLTYDNVQAALDSDQAQNPELAWFALVRWDQLAELVHRIGVGTFADLKGVLNQLGDQLLESDWHPPAQLVAVGEGPQPHAPTFRDRFRKLKGSDRFDYNMVVLARLELEGNLEGVEGPILAARDGSEARFIKLNPGLAPPLPTVGGTQIEPDGLLTYRSPPV